MPTFPKFPGLPAIPAVLVFLAASSLFLAGCGTTPGNNIVRYQTVEIPRFTRTDYVGLLENRDPELRYLGLCNLIPDAAELGRNLNREPGKETGFSQASNVLNRVALLLLSKDRQLATASLIFCAEILTTLTNKRTISDGLSRFRPRDRTMVFELLNALDRVRGKGREELLVIRKYVNDRDRLLRYKAYASLPGSGDGGLTGILLGRYAESRDESEQLMILDAVLRTGGPSAVAFARKNLFAENTDGRKMRSFLAILAGHDAPSSVAGLLAANAKSFGVEIARYTIDLYSPLTEPGIGFYAALLQTSFDLYSCYTNPECFRKFAEGLAGTNVSLAEKSGLEKIDAVLRADPRYRERWAASRTEVEHEARKQRIKGSLGEKYKGKILGIFSENLDSGILRLKKDLSAEGLSAGEIDILIEDYQAMLRVIQESITNR